MARITAAAIDPDRLYTYWEVTDQAIEAARARLNASPQNAWLSLRVYDTTGLIFRWHEPRVLQSPGRALDRQWFFDIGKPTSTAYVEVGMKSAEGYFAKSGAQAESTSREPRRRIADRA